jgi:alanyl-tRNA synthetase
MNKNLFNSDAYIREVISDVVKVQKIQWNNEEVYEFELEKTCFFPEQGGQTSDTGKFYDLDSSDVYEVFHCYIKDDTVYHLARLMDQESEEKTVLEQPRRIHGMINWEERFDKMQNHSGEHLVSGTVHRFFGFDNVGFALSADNCTLDFNGTFSDEDIELIENTVNRAVFENIEVLVLYPTDEELKKIDYRSKKELTGQVRIVEFPGYDVCACCAPHVKRTGEIGLIKIISAEHFKGGTRMTIRCGYRALKDYRTKLESCRSISKLLSVPIDDVASGTEKLNEDLRKARFDLIGQMNTILLLKANEVIKEENPVIFIETADMNAARATVNTMVKQSKGLCGIFIGTDEKGYSYIVSSMTTDCTAVLNSLKTQLNAKGGGSKSMIQGSVPSTENQIRDLLNKFSNLENIALI